MNFNPVLVAVALAFSVLLVGRDDITPSKVNVYEVGRRSAVPVHPHDGWGSGVVIRRIDPSGNPRWFVWTAAHVVNTSDKVEGGTVLARNEKLDVALIALDKEPKDAVSAGFSFVTPELGQEVFVVGSPYGPEYYNRIFFGKVSGVDERLNIQGWLWGKCDLFSGAVFPGNSGGPVYNEKAQVIGLIVARSPVVSIFQPVRYIAVWAESAGLRWALLGKDCPAPRGEFDVPPIDVN